jgi:hypothetical protein
MKGERMSPATTTKKLLLWVWFQHFFAEHLFILENEVRQFQIEFSRISAY